MSKQTEKTPMPWWEWVLLPFVMLIQFAFIGIGLIFTVGLFYVGWQVLFGG